MADGLVGAMGVVGVEWDSHGVAGLSQVQLQPVYGAVGSSDKKSGTMSGTGLLLASAGVGLGAGFTARAALGQKTAPEDVVLDLFTGAGFGSCLLSGPRAEAFCQGMWFAVPQQFINRAVFPKWKYQYGLLVGGAASLARAELGGNPIPFTGYELDDSGAPRLRPAELLANASIDILLDTTVGAATNLAAGFMQGNTDWLPLLAVGASYNGGLSLTVNGLLGAPIKLSAGTQQKTVANNLSHGGEDVTPLFRYTTFRAGGLGTLGDASITIGPDVAMATKSLTPDVFGHEMVHRSESAASGSGAGMVSWYSMYIGQSFGGYTNNPAEIRAFAIGQGEKNWVPRTGDADAWGLPIMSLTQLGLAHLLTPSEQ